MIFESLSSVAVFKALGAIFIIGFLLLITLNKALKQSVPRVFLHLGKLLSQLARSRTNLTPDRPVKPNSTSTLLSSNTTRVKRVQEVVQPTTAQQIERTAFNRSMQDEDIVVPTTGQQSEITPIRSEIGRDTAKFQKTTHYFHFHLTARRAMA